MVNTLCSDQYEGDAHMRILRLTRHAVSSEQLAELARIYGTDVEVVEVSESVPSVERIKELIAENSADVLEAVLPLPLVAQSVDPRNGVGVPVIRAAMNRVMDDSGNATFTFSYYEVVKKVVVETERL